MVRKIAQIIRRGPSTWLVCIYFGRDPETRKRKYVGKFIHGRLRCAQAHLNRKLAERDLGRNIRSSFVREAGFSAKWIGFVNTGRLIVPDPVSKCELAIMHSSTKSMAKRQ
jgi:hypothetical protein